MAKICIKGINCGNTCITKTKICRITLSKSTKDLADTLVKNIELAKREKNYDVEYSREERFDKDVINISLLNNGSTGKIKSEPSRAIKGAYEIDFEVNDSFEREEDTKDKIAIAKAIRKELLEYLSKQPEDRVFIAGIDILSDGSEMRQKAYKKAGFSDLIGDYQYASIKDGKLQPYDGDLVKRK